VTYQVAGKQYVAVTSGSTTRFWRTSPAAATITIFAVPAPTSGDDLSKPHEKVAPTAERQR
jgi:hypothetical protein